MFAHAGRIRATARKLNFPGQRKHSGALPAKPFHRCFRESSFKQLDEGIDLARAIFADRFPPGGGNCRDVYLHAIKSRPADQRRNGCLFHLKIDDATTSQVAAAARQSVPVIAVTLEVPAPGLPPERFCDLRPMNDDRRGFRKFRCLLLGLAASFSDRDVGSPIVIVVFNSRKSRHGYSNRAA